MLDDYASNYRYFKHQNSFKKDLPTKFEIYKYNCLKSIKHELRCVLKPISSFFEPYRLLIMPDNFFKLFWDTLILILLIVNIFYIPMKIAF